MGGPPDRTGVADLRPGRGNSRPAGLTCAKGGVLVFSANDLHDRDPRTLADPGATPILHDLSPAGQPDPLLFTPLGPDVFLVADDGTHGGEPWRLHPDG